MTDKGFKVTPIKQLIVSFTFSKKWWFFIPYNIIATCVFFGCDDEFLDNSCWWLVNHVVKIKAKIINDAN